MKKYKLVIVFLPTIIAVLLALYSSDAKAEVAPYSDPMHYYGISWRDTSAGSVTAAGRVAKAMGFEYIVLRAPGAAPSGYLPATYSDSSYDGLKFYFPDPYGWVTHKNLGFSTIGGYYTWSGITTQQKNWIKDYVAWNGTSTADVDAPGNLKAGWENDDTSCNLLLDFQQKRVRDLAVSDIVSIVQSYVDANGHDFKFAGWLMDIMRLYGDVHVDSGNGQTTWATWNSGVESCFIHNGSDGNPIVHDIATYSDATSQFYQDLNIALNNAFGTGTWKWGGNPWNAYNSNYTGVDEYIYAGSLRSDRGSITPNFLLNESNTAPLNWTTNSNNFNSAMSMTRSQIGSSPGMIDEITERQIAIAAGTSSSNFNFYGHFGNHYGTVMTVEDAKRRCLVSRAIPGWLNRWGISAGGITTEIIGGTITARAYKDGKLWSYIGKDFMWGRMPQDSNKIMAVFSGNPAVGSVTINSGEVVAFIKTTNGFMEETDDASGQFTISGNNIIPSGITPNVDGVAFVITLDNSSITASGSGSISTSGSGSITVE